MSGIVSVQELLFLFTFNVDFGEPWHRRVWDPLPSLPLLPARFKGSEEPCVRCESLGHWWTQAPPRYLLHVVSGSSGYLEGIQSSSLDRRRSRMYIQWL